jgi:hypothetical protein
MDAFVGHAAFGRGGVLGPKLFDVDQRALAWAIEVVLECRERD